MHAEYVDHMGTDLTVVNAARVSFDKHSTELTDGDAKLINYLARHKHWTPFGHPMITLRLKAPVFVRTQLFKHKVGFTENEVSRRYVDSEPEFYYPKVWRGRPTGGAKQGSSEEQVEYLTNGELSPLPTDSWYEHAVATCFTLYDAMIENGIAPEQARMVLPQSMYTEWYWTGSLAAYARMCGLRLDPHAQAETREIAQMCADIIQPLFPVSWEALMKE